MVYYDFGEDYNDYSIKLGIVVLFGKLMFLVFKDSDNDGVVDGKD